MKGIDRAVRLPQRYSLGPDPGTPISKGPQNMQMRV